MIHSPRFAVAAGTLYLVIYAGILPFPELLGVAWAMVFFFPVVTGWMAYVIIRFGKYEGPGLDDEEFGYQDIDKNDL